ncbi:MAG: hypothetical protein KDB93_14320 [Flavobacteriales bacterium]|nr:hypothetical protein [Flavobacteriales bacterium]
MDFLSFVQRNSSRQTDPGILAAAKIILGLEDLPRSSDPRILAQSLHKLMDPQATKGFQVMMMVYKDLEPANELPEELKRDPHLFLQAISHINELQNADPHHRWPSPLHQERFGKKK